VSAPVFLSVDDVATRLQEEPNGLRLIEVRRDTREAGPAEHLPGAVVAFLTTDLSRPGGEPTEGKRPLPHLDALQVTLRRWGIDDSTAVVVYDDGDSFVAARAWWVLRWAGVADVGILDGGLRSWLTAGHPAGPLAADHAEGDITVTGDHLDQLDADQAEALAAGGRLVDARTPEAFGAGHIPGARNVSSRETVTANGLLRDPDTLRYLYGLDDQRPNVPGLYCGGGVAAAHGVAVLAHLGISAPLYVGSFSAWSADPVRPVAETTSRSERVT